MNNVFKLAAAPIALTILLSGCAPTASTSSSGEKPGVVVPTDTAAGDAPRTNTVASEDQVLAEIQGVKLTDSQLKPVVYKAYGLDVLLKVIQLNMAKADASAVGITITPADVQTERKSTLELAFGDAKPEDYPELLKQLLTQQRVSEAEFDVVMEVNTYLRAIVKPTANAGITDEMVRNEFNSIYGERIVVRDIALNNMQEVVEAQAMLNGPTPKSFEEVARLMSRVPSKENGGLLPPFARTSPGYTPVFINAAFALETGKVSTDPIQDKGFYHIIKVEQRIAPRVQGYDEVKDSVREELVRRRQNALMAARRTEMAQLALRELRILEPTMKAEFDARMAAANPKPGEKAQLNKELDAISKEKADAKNKATTKP